MVPHQNEHPHAARRNRERAGELKLRVWALAGGIGGDLESVRLAPSLSE